MNNSILFLLAAFVLTSCGGSEKSAPETSSSTIVQALPQDKVEINYYAGDPGEFIEGAELSVQQEDLEFLVDQDIEINNVFSIEPQSPSEVVKNNVEDGEEATEGNQTVGNETDLSFHFTRNAKGHFQFKIHDNTQTTTLVVFEISDDLKTVIIFKEDQSVDETATLLHTSHKGSLVSLLIENQDKSIIMLVLGAKSLIEVTTDSSASEFFYLYGPGVKVNWEESVTFSLCKVSKSYELEYFNTAIQLWSKPLSNRLKIKLEDKREHFPPFSDLNTNCINILPQFLSSDPKTPFVEVAYTLNQVDHTNWKFTNSSIFFFEASFLKYYRSQFPGHSFVKLMKTKQVSNEFWYTLVHELGHGLGLHHQFTDGVPSVMSYSESDKGKGLFDYDVKAIQALYPLAPTTDKWHLF